MKSYMNSYDVIVIGGGLLGCFAARNLTRYNLKIALLEKREDLCTGISRANTAVVYAGCDTKPNTLKASMCVKSAKNFAQLCNELGVRYSACGSVMVSFGEYGAEVLRRKMNLGIKNGVRGMRSLLRGEILELEPNIAGNAHTGLFVPDTGTVMPWELCLAAAENAAHNGAEIMLNTEVTEIRHGKTVSGYEVHTNNGTFFTRGIVNCAGLAADSILEMISEPTVRILPSACDYFILDTKAGGHIRHVIFHEPEEYGKGLTLVPTVDGNILIGSTERQGDDFGTSDAGLNKLRELVSQVMPTLPLEYIIRSFGAVRPNPYLLRKSKHSGYTAETKSVNDFCVIESPDKTAISLVGIKTPGLTCANELGIYAADKMAASLGTDANSAFDPKCLPSARLSYMSFEERKSFIQKENPAYNKIICNCRGITEGEIIDAIQRFPGATTLDGVKRRTGAGSGCCQGSSCARDIIEILAQELKRTPEEITKDGEDSYFFSSNT